MDIFNGVVYLSEEQFKTLVKDETITVERQKEDGTTESITIQYDRNSFFTTPEEPPDKTLSKSGAPADAQATGEKIAEVQASGKLYRHNTKLSNGTTTYECTIFSKQNSAFTLDYLKTNFELLKGVVLVNTDNISIVIVLSVGVVDGNLDLTLGTTTASLAKLLPTTITDTVYEV